MLYNRAVERYTASTHPTTPLQSYTGYTALYSVIQRCILYSSIQLYSLYIIQRYTITLCISQERRYEVVMVSASRCMNVVIQGTPVAYLRWHISPVAYLSSCSMRSWLRGCMSSNACRDVPRQACPPNATARSVCAPLQDNGVDPLEAHAQGACIDGQHRVCARLRLGHPGLCSRSQVLTQC